MSIDYSDFGFRVDDREILHVTCITCGAKLMAEWQEGQVSDITESCREHASETGHGAA